MCCMTRYKVQQLKRAAMSWLPLWVVLPSQEQPAVLFILARPLPSAQADIPVGLDTGCSPEAGVCRCGPSTQSNMNRYHEVPSHGTPLFLVVTPTVMHFACKATSHAPILQLYRTTKAPQHQISQQQSFSSGPVGKLATFLGAVQNATVATLQFRTCNSGPRGMLPTRRRHTPGCSWCCPVGL